MNLMCKAPILIDNPDYNSPVKDPVYRYIHNVKDSKIAVPCGRCSSCVHLKQIYIVQRVQMEALNNDLFFGTLTYNNDSLPTAQYGDIRFSYPDYSDWQRAVKMIRKDFPDLEFKYMLISEYGGKKHRPHFHFILSVPRTSDLLSEKVSTAYRLFDIFLKYWRRNYGSTRKPIWKPLCTYVRRGEKYNYDLHYLDPNSSKDGLDGVSFYVTKYLLKFDDYVEKFKSLLYFNLPYDDYKEAWLKFKPRMLLSKHFGLPYDKVTKSYCPKVSAHIRKGIDFSLSFSGALFPFYVSQQNGSTYPLAPYYSRRFLSISDQLEFVSRRPDINFITALDIDDFIKDQSKFDKVKSFLRSKNTFFDMDMSDVNLIFDTNGNYQQDSFSPEVFADSWQDF